MYAISSVSIAMGPSAAAVCLAVRYFGFCISIAIVNYFDLYEKSRHYNAFQDHLTKLDPAVKHTINIHAQNLLSRGMYHGQAVKASNKLLVSAINSQSHLRFAMDYYEMMSWLLIVTILLIALFPYLNRTVIYLKSTRLSPA
jgi:hypothetical protein